MRDHLISYLLELLEAEERTRLETCLQNDAQLRAELEVFRRALELLEHDDERLETPAALAHRTCQRLLARHNEEQQSARCED